MESVDTLKEREKLEICLDEKLAKLFEVASLYENRVDLDVISNAEAEIKHNKENREKNHELLNIVLSNRNNSETEELIGLIDQRISDYEESNLINSEQVEEVYNDFLDGISSLLETEEDSQSDSDLDKTKEIVVIDEENVNEEDVDKLLDYIDKRVESIENEFSNEVEEEYQFFSDDKVSVNPPTEQDISNLFNPLGEKGEKALDDVFELTDNISKRDFSKLSREEIDDFIKQIDDKLAVLEKEEKALEGRKEE